MVKKRSIPNLKAMNIDVMEGGLFLFLSLLIMLNTRLYVDFFVFFVFLGCKLYETILHIFVLSMVRFQDVDFSIKLWRVSLIMT